MFELLSSGRRNNQDQLFSRCWVGCGFLFPSEFPVADVHLFGLVHHDFVPPVVLHFDST